jgi:hypothetical protein
MPSYALIMRQGRAAEFRFDDSSPRAFEFLELFLTMFVIPFQAFRKGVKRAELAPV